MKNVGIIQENTVKKSLYSQSGKRGFWYLYETVKSNTWGVCRWHDDRNWNITPEIRAGYALFSDAGTKESGAGVYCTTFKILLFLCEPCVFLVLTVCKWINWKRLWIYFQSEFFYLLLLLLNFSQFFFFANSEGLKNNVAIRGCKPCDARSDYCNPGSFSDCCNAAFSQISAHALSMRRSPS